MRPFSTRTRAEAPNGGSARDYQTSLAKLAALVRSSARLTDRMSMHRRRYGGHPVLPRTGSSAGAWCETWLCSGGQPTAVNSAQGCPVNDLQSAAARFGGTAPSCALFVAGAASGEPWEVRMTGVARGETGQSSMVRGRRRAGGRRVVRSLGKRSSSGAAGADLRGLVLARRPGFVRCAAAGSRQPICSARATMMPAGPRR